jgi:hypothetical protein
MGVLKVKQKVLLFMVLIGMLAACRPAAVEPSVGSGKVWVTVTPGPALAEPVDRPSDVMAEPVAMASSTIATAWFELLLDLVETTPGFTPPVAARALGYAGVTLYEALVPGMPDYQSLAGQLTDMPPMPPTMPGEIYHWPTVANSALGHVTRYLFANTSPENMAAIEALEQELSASFGPELDPAVVERSLARGDAITEAVFHWSMTDGGHEGYLRNFPEDYVAPSGAGMWVSTAPNFSKALQPYWGNNRPFVSNPAQDCPIAPPPDYSEAADSAFYLEAMEVYDSVNTLTDEQNAIALFWADDPGKTPTPPGHSISILSQVLTEQNASLETAAEAYAKLGIAVSDAFIGCWYNKYQYNLIRPISYIQQVIDPNWNTPEITDPVITPPFPEYPSGHSVQSGAAAQILTELFGENYQFTDHTHDARGLAPRSFDSFFEFADEAAVSRLYGGIHYSAAIKLGVEEGKCIGRQVSALKFKVG